MSLQPKTEGTSENVTLIVYVNLAKAQINVLFGTPSSCIDSECSFYGKALCKQIATNVYPESKLSHYSIRSLIMFTVIKTNSA